jgi:hypothetical protein
MGFILNIKQIKKSLKMALAETLLANRSVDARIQKIELSIPILQDHLDKFADEMDPEALEFIVNNIAYLERELEIRKDFPYTYF